MNELADGEAGSLGVDTVLSLACRYVTRTGGPIAVHAGHFMLLPDGEKCVPSVATSVEAMQGWKDDPADSIRNALNAFSLATWRAGTALVARFRSVGLVAKLFVLANDWQYLRGHAVPNASALRRRFYESQTEVFASYGAILKEFGLDSSVILSLDGTRPVVSEYWLRRCNERRLKRILRSGNAAAQKLSVESQSDGTRHLVFDDFGRACRLLMCGQADCAGEVMELVYRLYEKGYRQLVNIVPVECKIPVNEGTRRAIAVFGLADFTALNIAVPCLAAAPAEIGSIRQDSYSRVTGKRIDSSVDAVVESVHSASA